jgi:hypothetical protein
LQFVLARIRLLVGQVIVILVVAAVFLYFGHHGQMLGMIEVKEQFDGLLAAAHLDQLAAYHC